MGGIIGVFTGVVQTLLSRKGKVEDKELREYLFGKTSAEDFDDYKSIGRLNKLDTKVTNLVEKMGFTDHDTFVIGSFKPSLEIKVLDALLDYFGLKYYKKKSVIEEKKFRKK
jgi:hypothetical protein